MFTTPLLGLAASLWLADGPPLLLIHAAAEAALPTLRQAVTTHAEAKTCYGCHNQGPPLAALRLAHSRGLPSEASVYKQQREHVIQFVAGNRDKFTNGTGTGGHIDTAGTLLMTLEDVEHTADENTQAVVQYLLKFQAKQDHWTCTSDRPPTEASHFTTTYLAIRGLQRWAGERDREAVDQRIRTARGWLEKTSARDTEDAVFRLLALQASGAAEKELTAAGRTLLELQRPDGGWSQRPGMDSDVYATGTALTALALAGTIKTSEPSYRRGLTFLISRQLPDGTWYVKSRSKPFQKYYESGFPHGKDQFISAMASGWATQALLHALPTK